MSRKFTTAVVLPGDPAADLEAVPRQYVTTQNALLIPLTQRAAALGVATLDAATKIPVAQLPTGTTSTTVTIGDDTRVVNAVQNSRQVIAGTGLTGGGTLVADRTLTVTYGTSGTSAAAGNDARLSDSRAPNGTAGGALNGTYPNPALDVVPWPPVTLTDAATIATDASLGNHFRVTLTASRTLGNPTNLIDGQRLTWEIIQNATGGWALTLDTLFAFGTDITAIALTATPSKRDFLGGIYNSSTNKIYVVAFIRGY